MTRQTPPKSLQTTLFFIVAYEDHFTLLDKLQTWNKDLEGGSVPKQILYMYIYTQTKVKQH